MNNLTNWSKLGVLVISVALMASCKKDTEAFPKNTAAGGVTNDFVYGSPTLPSIKDADGILAAVHVHNYRTVVISPVEKEFQYGMAEFTNSTGNFGTLTSGGSLTVDTSALTANSTGMYQSYATTYSLNFASNVTWNVTGAGSVPAQTYTLTNQNPSYTLFSTPSSNISYWNDAWIPAYPKTNDPTYNSTVYLSIPIKGYAMNCDSVVIGWHDNAGFSFFKKFAATDSLATFTPNDFTGYPNYNKDSDFQMEINMVSYQNAIVSGKKYYYIRMGSYVKYWRTN